MRVVGIPIIGDFSGSIAGLNVSLRPPFSGHNPFITHYFFGGGVALGGMPLDFHDILMVVYLIFGNFHLSL